jgi:calreticulin
MIYASVSIVLAAAAVANGKVYFKENFNDAGWETRWKKSTDWKPAAEMGKWDWTAGNHYSDASDKGIKTGEDARFYGLSAKMDSPLTNDGKEMVIQMTVKHEQDLDCGGAYIKLMPDMDQSKFGGDTPYAVMFGPDICGPSNRKTHAIFNYPPKNDNLLIKDELRTETDDFSHVYSLVVKPDNTYEVFIDLESIRSGDLSDGWDFLLPKEINDPSISKPADWVDDSMMDDPNDVKPDGYDDMPTEIPDPEATKPDDWDDEEDGEWEAPMIDNPDYKGPWSPKRIDNPDYKGQWEHPKIPNPDFVNDPKLHARCKDCTHVGFELWQVKAGTLFDDIIVTDSWAEAKAYAEETWSKKKDGEKKMYDENKAAKEAADKEAADAAGEGAEGDSAGDDEDDHEEL